MIGRHAMERHSAGTLFLATDFEKLASYLTNSNQ